MLVKTVRITNPRNVLVQIPSFIIGNWNLTLSDKLEVHYDEEAQEVTIKQAVRRRGGADEESQGMA